jgi:hypothetical protein
MRGFLNGYHILETLFEKIRLQTECPSVDIAVVVLQIRVEAHGLKPWLPPIVFG